MNFRKAQLDSPVMPHVQELCHWCEKTDDEVALDSLAVYAMVTEKPGETIRVKNKSRSYQDGYDVALICFKNADVSQPRACNGFQV